jgi:hypothetical protein
VLLLMASLWPTIALLLTVSVLCSAIASWIGFGMCLVVVFGFRLPSVFGFRLPSGSCLFVAFLGVAFCGCFPQNVGMG